MVFSLKLLYEDFQNINRNPAMIEDNDSNYNWAPTTKVRQNLSIVAKNENSTEHFVHCT